MDCYGTAYEVDPVAGGWQLENQVFEGNGVVVADNPLVLARQHQLQLDARQFDEGAFRLGRFNREAAIEVGDELLLQVAVGRAIIGNALMPELLWQAPLDGAEGTLAAAAGLRRTGQDLLDPECAQGLAPLAVLFLVHFAGRSALAEVAAAVGVELTETAVVAQHRFQRGEGRSGALLGQEEGVQDAAVGIAQRHSQVLPRQPAYPFMGRGVQMNQHASHRSPFAPAPVFAARGFALYYPGFLEH